MELSEWRSFEKLGIESVYESEKNCTILIWKKKMSLQWWMVILCTIDNMNKNKVNFAYLINVFTLWHVRLCHIGASTIKRTLKCDMISYNRNEIYKCKTYIESKNKKEALLYCK